MSEVQMTVDEDDETKRKAIRIMSCPLLHSRNGKLPGEEMTRRTCRPAACQEAAVVEVHSKCHESEQSFPKSFNFNLSCDPLVFPYAFHLSLAMTTIPSLSMRMSRLLS